MRRVHREFFTKSFLGDDVAALALSSGEEPASPRYRASVHTGYAWCGIQTSTGASCSATSCARRRRAAGSASARGVVGSGAAAAGGLRQSPSSRFGSDCDRWTASAAATRPRGGRGAFVGETARARSAAGRAARRKNRHRRRRRRDRTPPSPPRSARELSSGRQCMNQIVAARSRPRSRRLTD